MEFYNSLRKLIARAEANRPGSGSNNSQNIMVTLPNIVANAEASHAPFMSEAEPVLASLRELIATVKSQDQPPYSNSHEYIFESLQAVNELAQTILGPLHARIAEANVHDEQPPPEGSVLDLIYVNGAPAAGKGTICQKLAANHDNWVHLSVGDYLRKLSNSEQAAEFPKEARSLYSASELQQMLAANENIDAKPMANILIWKIKDVLRTNGKSFHLILDGFPRTLESVDAFEKKMKKPLTVIGVDCDRQVAFDRYMSRKREPDADTQARFDKRYNGIEMYLKLTDKQAYYGLPMSHINTTHLTEDEAYQRMISWLKKQTKLVAKV